ncbi:MAG: peptidase [Candidatus Angelobacter sp.]|jgi:Zn-dependent M28 family amino/carboxypeptidase|nr:peptidase [Candidatus Angelobacter sp.]
MRALKIFALGFAPIFLICGVLALLTTQPIFVKDALARAALSDPEHLRTYVRTLASSTSPRSYPRLENLNKAADFIREEFAATGASVSEQVYEVDGQSLKNIIAVFGPDSAERIVVGAHYDTYGGMPGADDNASGVAGLIELARLLSSARLPMRVELVAYTLEEPPFFRTEHMGSMVHAAKLKAEGAKVRAMISLEMIGYFSDRPGSQHYPMPGMGLIYPDAGNYIAVVGSLQEIGLVRRVKKAMVQAGDLPVWSTNAPSIVPGIDFSDHASYWEQEYPAVMVTDTAFYRNRNYHHPTDLPETLDYKRMAKVVDQLYGAILQLTN